jgi:resolvase-like protein
MSGPFVAYYRVSTDRQGRSGLGLEAQQAAVRHYLGSETAIAEFTEVETGKRNDRPELDRALALCRKRKARLVIAKLDRLSRNLAFIAALMDASVEFVAVDNPHATRLTLHILAAEAIKRRESPFDARRLRSMSESAATAVPPIVYTRQTCVELPRAAQRDVPKSYVSAAASMPTAGDHPGNRTTSAWAPSAPAWGLLLRGFWRGHHETSTSTIFEFGGGCCCCAGAAALRLGANLPGAASALDRAIPPGRRG